MAAISLAAPAAAQVKGADMELLGEVRELADRIAVIRQRPFARQPVAVRAPREFRLVAAEARAAAGLPRARLDARGRAWADLGLGGAATPAALRYRLAYDLEGATFDPSGPRLLIDPERLKPTDFFGSEAGEEPAPLLRATGVRPDEPLVAHVLMHLHQHERDAGRATPATTDELLARSAWSEGEANLIAVTYLFRSMGIAGEVLEAGLDPGLVLEGALLPPAADGAGETERRLLEFVYHEGFARAAEAQRAGGWSALEQAIAARHTTRAILHAVDEAAPAPDRLPSPRLDPPPGFTLADTDVLGEHAVGVLIAALSGKDDLGLQAADGWRADGLYRWEPERAGADPDEGITVWATRWAGAQDAGDFEYGLLRGLRARFPDHAAEATGEGRHRLVTPDRVYRIERDGNEVRIRVAPPAIDRRLDAVTSPG